MLQTNTTMPPVNALPSPLKMRVWGLNDEQFEHLCEENPDLHFELNNQGELLVMSPTGYESGWRNSELNYQVMHWVKQQGNGKVFDSSTLFEFPSGAKRQPDVAWISQPRIDNAPLAQRSGIVRLVPDFVIELRSPTDSLPELQAKMEEYINNGVRLGWLIDPQTRRVHIYAPQRETVIFDDPESVSGADVLPGFTLDVREVW